MSKGTAVVSDLPCSDFLHPLSRREAPVAGVLLAWRRLTGGQPTILALSGGADSSALLLALASGGEKVRQNLIAVHVIHDLRPRQEALRDRDACVKLCRAVGVKLVVTEVRVRDAVNGMKSRERNLEAMARKLRYRALAEVARNQNALFIATGHQADDHLETMLMHLLRGCGMRGLAGIAAKSLLARDFDQVGSARSEQARLSIVRPMVLAGLTRDQTQAICTQAAWEWIEDATNADESRLRAAVRDRIVPKLKELRGDVAAKSVATGEMLRQAEAEVQRAAARLRTKAMISTPDHESKSSNQLILDRKVLASASGIVLGAMLRRELLKGERRGCDRLTRRVVDPIVRAITDGTTDPRIFRIADRKVRVLARQVVLT